MQQLFDFIEAILFISTVPSHVVRSLFSEVSNRMIIVHAHSARNQHGVRVQNKFCTVWRTIIHQDFQQ